MLVRDNDNNDFPYMPFTIGTLTTITVIPSWDLTRIHCWYSINDIWY